MYCQDCGWEWELNTPVRTSISGLTCAALECFIAPYNDYVIRNAKRDEFWVHLFSGA